MIKINQTYHSYKCQVSLFSVSNITQKMLKDKETNNNRVNNKTINAEAWKNFWKMTIYTLRHTYIFTLFTGSHYDTWRRIMRLFGPILRSLLTDNPHSPGKVTLATLPLPTSLTLFEQWCGFFYVPHEPDQWKCCEPRPTAFRPYQRRLESLTVCITRQHFLLSFLKTLSVGPARIWTRELPLSRPALSQLS